MGAAHGADAGPGALTRRNYLAYAAGEAANTLSFTMAGMFLILYYTNVVGVEGAVIGTMFLVVRLVDAVTDLFVVRLLDAREPGRRGRFKLFIRWFSLPLLLSSMAIYSARAFFPEISGGAAVAYMSVTYLLMGPIFHTLVAIPYGSMVPALTQVPAERGRLAAARGYAGAGAVLVLAFIIAPQVSGDSTDPDVLQQSLLLTTAGFVVAGMALYLFLVLGTPEPVTRPTATVSLGDSLRALTTNRPLRRLSVGSILVVTGATAFSTLSAYIAIYVQWDGLYIAWNTLAQTVALLVVGPLIPAIVRTIGKRAGYIVLTLVMALGAAVLAFAPLQTTPPLGLLAFFLVGIGLNGVHILVRALEADTVEYGARRTGDRAEEATYAVSSLTRRSGQALGGFVGGVALTAAGYSAARASSGESQDVGVADSIQLWTGGLLGAFALLSIAAMAFYPLTEARSRETASG